MTTAIGAYATLAGMQARIGNLAAGDAAELQKFCGQTNAWIEQRCGRALAPLPVVKSKIDIAVLAGATAVHVATPADIVALAIGDELAIGPVTGTHESSPVLDIVPDATPSDGSTITLGVPLENAYGINAPLERVYLRDGFDAASGDDIVPGRCLVDLHGIVKLTALEIASYTRGPWSVIPSTDYWLRPTPQYRDPGWPATELYMTNIPSPTNPYPTFFPGYGNVRLWGVVGWPVISDDMVGLAERVVAAHWQMKSGGGAYSVAPGSDAAQQIPHLLSTDDWKLIQRYTLKSIEVIG
jgi:hypothetical protein